MPLATDVLRTEHTAILRMLDALDEVGRRLVDGRGVSATMLPDLLTFFTTFADRCHHAKEEQVLFPRLQARGMSLEMGPIAVMLGEHEVGRSYVRRMRESAERFAAGRVDAAEPFVNAAAEYSGMLREHIEKENEVLFPMAEQVLGPIESIRVAEEFERVEAAIGIGVHADMHALMDRVLAALGPLTPAVATIRGGGGCCGGGHGHGAGIRPCHAG